MEYLLDTHIFLWWLNGDKRLKKNVKDVITNPTNSIYVSVISAWEIAIKLKSNPNFKLKTSLKTCFKVSEFELINLTLDHIFQLEKLPLIHKDPFDRILISQAKAEKLTLITSDKKIGKYDVRLLKASL
ncbi:type II toxin-antitoxin system VapC family toxin [Patescibacteria group bacterium]|nr:type II toxin-antitoxin system VapC family toxin [Patescibacteria group bacterium]